MKANMVTAHNVMITAIAEAFSLELDELFKASHGLAGGVGLSGSGTCGVLSGGIMVSSHLHGRRRKDFAKGRFPLSYQLEGAMRQVHSGIRRLRLP
jgi:hypothetical protein